MLTNPYGKLNAADNPAEACRVQTDIPVGEKSLLLSMLPRKDAFKLTINNLLYNLCQNIRELNLNPFDPNAATVLGILCEPRPLSDDQLRRIALVTGGTYTSTSPASPAGVHLAGSGEGVCATTPRPPQECSESPEPTSRRKRGTRKASQNTKG